MNELQSKAMLRLTGAQFKKLASIIRDDSGIVLTEAKRDLLMARLNRRLRELQLESYSAYCSYLDSSRGAEERRHLLTAVTTNVTSFFRERHHFEALATQILPPLISSARRGERIRLWSSACSSGEEAYSIAMTVLEVCPDAAQYDVLILATDIDPEMIRRASEGRFSEESLHPISTARQRKFFVASGNDYIVGPQLRRIMRFADLNLLGPWPFSGQFDVIFCRNVVIYFGVDMRLQLWQRLAGLTKPAGHLLLGHSERLDGPATREFELVGVTQYRRISPAIVQSQPEGDRDAR